MDRTRSRLTAVFACTAILLSLCCGVVYFVIPALYDGMQVWKGYYLLLVPEEIPAAQVSEILSGAGFSEIVSEESVMVKVFGYEGLETIPLGLLEGRFESSDPRYDPYMRGLPGYFRAAGVTRPYRIVYVPSGANPLAFYLRAARGFHGTGSEWRVIEWDPVRQVVLFVFFLALVVVTTVTVRKGRMVILAGAVPWTSFLVHGDTIVFAGSCLFFLAWALVYEEWREIFFHRLHYPGSKERGRFRQKVTVAVLLLGVYAVISVASGEAGMRLLPMVAGLSANGLLVLGVAGIAVVRRERREHRVFIPVSILGRPGSRERKLRRSLVGPVAAAAVFLFSSIVGSVPFAEIVRVPVNRPHPGAESFSRDSLSVLWHDRGAGRLPGFTEGSLPGLAEYVAHRAYQESFAYGGVYAFPRQEEPVYLSTYRMMPDRRVVEERMPVVGFEDEWFSTVIDGTLPGSIERLLRRQPTPGEIVGTPVSRETAGADFLLRLLLLCLPLCVAGMPMGRNLTSPSLYGMRRTLKRRRQQQE